MQATSRKSAILSLFTLYASKGDRCVTYRFRTWAERNELCSSLLALGWMCVIPDGETYCR